MNRYRHGLLLALCIAPLLCGAGQAWELVTASEYQSDQKSSEVVSSDTPFLKKGGLEIQVALPFGPGKSLHNPFDFKIAFVSDGKEQMDPDSVHVEYGRTGMDITERLRSHAIFSPDGIFARDVTMPEGNHRITISVANTDGTVTRKSIDFAVAADGK